MSGKPGDTIPFNLADIGEGIAEVEIMKWFVQVGDPIAQFQKLCEVQSDKATVEITSRFDGVVASIGPQVGQMAKVGAPLCFIKLTHGVGAGAVAPPKTGAGAPAAPAAPASSSKGNSSWFDKLPSVEVDTTPRNSVNSTAEQRDALEEHNDKVLTTPAVRRLAREHQIDLATVPATGAGGRVMKEDILAFIASGGNAKAQQKAAPTASPPSAAPKAAPAPSAAAAAPAAPTGPVYSAEDRVEKISGINRVMVQSMTRAAAVPTFLYCDEVMMDSLIQLRAQLKPAADAAGIKLSYMPFLIKVSTLIPYHAICSAECGKQQETVVPFVFSIG